MSQITGYVKEIYEGKVSKGKRMGSPFWSITLDTDAKLSTFNADYMTGVVEGREYTFTYESDGQYANLTAPSVPVIQTKEAASLKASLQTKTVAHDDLKEENQPRQVWEDSETTSPDSTTAPPVDELPPPKASTPAIKGIPSFQGGKDEAIRKAVALKAAVEFSDSVAGSTGNIKKIIEYAKEFEKYLGGDDEDLPF